MSARLCKDDFAHLVERQLSQWERAQAASGKKGWRAHLADGAAIDYITISRELGSGGEEIGRLLAEMTGWQCYDRDILNCMAENMNVHVRALESVDEKTIDVIDDWLLPLLGGRSSKHVEQLSYYKHLGKMLMVIAQHGRAIIVGRAAGLVLPRERGLSVRVTAPFEVRCKRYAAEHDMELGQALTLVQKADDMKGRFVQDFVGKDVRDSRHYDLVIDTGKLPPRAVAKLLWRALDERVISKQARQQAPGEGPDLDAIVERQMREWSAEGKKERGAARARLVSGAEVDYITLTRDEGSGGQEAAQLLGKLLGWRVYDHEVLDYMAQRMDVHVRMLEGLDERALSWINDRLMPFMAGKSFQQVRQSRYYHHLGEQLLIIAMHGRAIILGRGAAQLLPREKGLSVWVTAPLEMRYRRYAAEKGLRLDAATRQVKQADKEYRRFVQSFVDKKMDDPSYYDLICNTEKFTSRSVAKLISRAFDKRAFGERD